MNTQPQLKLRSKSFIFLLSLAIACGSFVMGHALVSTALLQKQIQAYNKISNADIQFYLSIIVTLLPLGALLGCLINNRFVQQLGEKDAMITVDILMIIAVILQAVTLDLRILYMTRFIFGFFCGISSSIIPPYLISIAPLNMVGIIGSLSQLMITIGISAAYGMVFFLQSNLMQKQVLIKIFVLVPSVFCLIRLITLIWVFPYNTVQRHFKNDQIDEVKQIMNILYQNGASYQDFCKQKNLKTSNNTNQLQQSNYQGVNKQTYQQTQQQKNTSKRRILILCVVLGIANQLCGINAIFFYAKQLFTNLTNNNQELVKLDIFGIGLFQVVMTFVASCVLDKFGRRFFMLLGYFIICLSLFGAFLATDVFKLSSNVVVLFVFLHILGFSISLGPICCLYASQIMNDISVIITLIWGLTLVVSLFSNYLINNLGIGKTFLIFGMISLGCFIYVWQQMIQSKGLSRKQMEIKFGYADNRENVRIQSVQQMEQKRLVVCAW